MEEVAFVSGGESVHGVLHEAEGTPRGSLVLVHGFMSCSVEFMDAGERLAERGWNVLLFDQRGCGNSGGERGRIARERAVDDIRNAVRFLEGRGLGDRIGLVGHSMGTAFVSAAAPTLPSVSALVQVAPLRSVPSELSRLEFQAYRVAHAVSRLKEQAGLGPLRVPYKTSYADLYVDKAAATRADELKFLQDAVSLSNYPELVALDGEALARKVTTPTLVLVCEHDTVVSPQNSLAVYEAFAGEKRMERLPCGHSAFGDREQKRVLDHVDAWMAKHLAGKATETHETA